MILASLFLAAVLLAFVAGLPGLLGRDPHGLVFRRFMTAAGGFALTSASATLFLGHTWILDRGWRLPGARFLLQGEPLGAFFLMVLALSIPCIAWYLVAYWRVTEAPPSLPRARCCFGLLAGAMMLLTHAANSVLFLMAWELLALSGYFLVMTEDTKPEVQTAGWLYLVASHASALLILAGFAILATGRGSWDLTTLPTGFAKSASGTAAFLLLTTGFAIKAGLMPFHIWLPGAHASAPTPVSAALSGLVLKMGLLGLARLVTWIPDPPLWWGTTWMGLGALSGVLGLAYALAQRDLKRILAYSSVENVGIVALGLGLATVGKATGNGMMIMLGTAGALFHVLNHAIFKPMLFMGAGNVLHATGSRDLEQMGGLLKRMPKTGGLFLLASAAIAGLPPLNGFVGEWLICMGSFRGLAMGGWPGVCLPLAALALISGLALATFSRVAGIVFLGEPRKACAEQAHEVPPDMILPMKVLAVLCLVLGLAPIMLLPALHRAASMLAPEQSLPALSAAASLPALTLVALMSLVVAVPLWLRLRRVPARRDVTWDCGYAAPTPRIQYTASSFAQMIVDAFQWALGSRLHPPRIRGLFPRASHLERIQPDAVLDRILMPFSRFAAHLMGYGRRLQSGLLPVYLLYMIVTLVLLFVTLLP